jgi:hypothetical protein
MEPRAELKPVGCVIWSVPLASPKCLVKASGQGDLRCFGLWSGSSAILGYSTVMLVMFDMMTEVTSTAGLLCRGSRGKGPGTHGLSFILRKIKIYFPVSLRVFFSDECPLGYSHSRITPLATFTPGKDQIQNCNLMPESIHCMDAMTNGNISHKTCTRR